MAKKTTGDPTGGDDSLGNDLSKAFQKAGIAAKDLRKIVDALNIAGYKFAKAHEEAETNIKKSARATTELNRLMRESIASSNEYLSSQLNANSEVRKLSQARRDLIALSKTNNAGAEYANILLEDELTLLKSQAALYGHEGELAEFVAKQLQKGLSIQKIQEQQQFKDLKYFQQTIDFRKKELEQRLAIKKRAEEVQKSHDKLKDTIKQELMFAKEMANNPKLLGALIAGQLVSLLGKANQELQRLIANGSTAGEAFRTMRENVSLMSILGLSKVSEVSDSLIAKFGSMNAMTKEQRHAVGEMASYYGLAGDEATNLTMAIAQMPGQSMDTATNFKKTAESVGKLRGVMPSQIMKEMAKNTQNMAIYTKGGVEGFARAAAEAKRLGLELSGVLNAAERTLDFESSINDQMEASVLLGKEINMDRLREASLSGDANAIMREQTAILRQVGDLDKMNVLQKRALEKALGMTTEEMKKFNAEVQFNEKYFGATSGPIDNFIGNAIRMGGAVGGFIKENGTMILTLIATAAQLATYAALTGAKTQATVRDTAATLGQTAAQNAETASTAANSTQKRLNAVQMQVYNGLRAQGLTATAAYTAAKNIETTSETVNTAGKGRGIIATVASTIATGALNVVTFVRNGILAAGNLIMAASVGLLSLFGMGTTTAGAAAGAATPMFAGFGAGLAALAQALAAPTPIGPVIGVLLGLGAVFLMIGASVYLAGQGIKAAAEGFVTLLNSVQALPEAFGKMISQVGGLFLVGAALVSIGAGLAMISVFGMGALPIILGLTTLAGLALGGGLGGGGGGGVGEESKNKDVVDAIKELKGAIQDMKVVLDAGKLAEAGHIEMQGRGKG